MNKLSIIYPKEALSLIMSCDCEDIEIDISDIQDIPIDPDTELEDQVKESEEIVEAATEQINFLLEALDLKVIDIEKTDGLIEYIDQNNSAGTEDLSINSYDDLKDILINRKLEAIGAMLRKILNVFVRVMGRTIKKLYVTYSLINKNSADMMQSWSGKVDKFLREHPEAFEQVVYYYPIDIVKNFISSFEVIAIKIKNINNSLNTSLGNKNDTINKEIDKLEELVDKVTETKLMTYKKYETLAELGYNHGSLMTNHANLTRLLSDLNLRKVISDINSQIRSIGNESRKLDEMIIKGELERNSDTYKITSSALEDQMNKVKAFSDVMKKASNSVLRLVSDTYKLYYQLEKLTVKEN